MDYLVRRYDISERRACKLVGQNRSTQRYAAMSAEGAPLVATTAHGLVEVAPTEDPTAHDPGAGGSRAERPPGAGAGASAPGPDVVLAPGPNSTDRSSEFSLRLVPDAVPAPRPVPGDVPAPPEVPAPDPPEVPAPDPPEVPWKTWPAATEEDPPAAAHACSVRGALVIAETAARIPLYVMASATRIPVQMVGDVAGRLGLHVPSCRRVRQT